MKQTVLPGTLVAVLLWLGGVGGAAAQSDDNLTRNLNRMRTPYAWDWVGDNAAFDQPVWLARCTGPCPSDGLLLVPDPELYRPGTLTRLGGPYSNRLEFEYDRNRLVAAGLPAYSLRVHIFDWNGDEVGAFWFGSRPSCGTPQLAGGPLTGAVGADLSPAPPVGRPAAFPVPFDWPDYERAVEEMRPVCAERARNARPTPNHICSGAYGCRPIGSPTGN